MDRPRRAHTEDISSDNREQRSLGPFGRLFNLIGATQGRGGQANIGQVSEKPIQLPATKQENHQQVNEEINEAPKPFEGVWGPLTEQDRLVAEAFLQELAGKSKDIAEGGARALQILETTVRWLDQLQQQTATEKDLNAGIALLKELLDELILSEGGGVETPFLARAPLTPAVKVSVQLYTLLESIIPFDFPIYLHATDSQSPITQIEGGQEPRLSILLHYSTDGYQSSKDLLDKVQLVLRYAIEKKHEVPKYRVLLKVRDALVGMYTGSEKINVDIATLAQFLWFVRDREVSKSDGEGSDSDEVNEYFSKEVEEYINRLEHLNRLRLSNRGAEQTIFNFINHLTFELSFIATAFQKWKNNEKLSVQEKVATYIWTVCDPNGVLNPNSIASRDMSTATQIFLNRSRELVKSWKKVERQSNKRALEANQRHIQTKLDSLIKSAYGDLNG